jgi:hypothetical protein
LRVNKNHLPVEKPLSNERQSEEIKTSSGPIPLHPIFLAIYFVLSLLGLNISQLFPQEAFRSLLFVFAFTGLMLLIMRLIFKEWQRGALATSLLLVLFFSYGHVYNFLEKTIPALGRHRLLLPFWVFLAVIGLWLIARRLKNPIPISKALNVAALVALVFPVYQIVSWEIRQAQTNENIVVNVPGIGNLKLATGQTPPDVYFIVLDMYARQDVLNEFYNIDNSVFLNDLKKLGFEVVECSQSNYSQTEMVLTSILNMNYLDALGHFDPSTNDTSVLRHLIKSNTVMRAFRSLGYKLVSFETGFHFSEFYDADYYLTPETGSTILYGRMNPFEVMLLKSTLSLALSDFAKILPSFLIPNTKQPLETKREQILFDLEELETIPLDISGPKFVFAHILALHEPFVFSSDGSPVNYPEVMGTEQNYAAYRDQLEFINNRLLPILEYIIEDSDPKPIIILQGDTGPGLVSQSGRMANLSAFYLPGYDQSLSPMITPVNNFRLVFDQYFGADLDLLPDYSNFSLYTSPFDLQPIPNDCIPEN